MFLSAWQDLFLSSFLICHHPGLPPDTLEVFSFKPSLIVVVFCLDVLDPSHSIHWIGFKPVSFSMTTSLPNAVSFQQALVSSFCSILRG